MVSVEVKHHERKKFQHIRGLELCEQGGGPGPSFPTPSLLSLVVSVDVKHHERRKRRRKGVPAWFCLKGSTRWSGWINAVTFTVSSTLPHDTAVLAALRREGGGWGWGGVSGAPLQRSIVGATNLCSYRQRWPRTFRRSAEKNPEHRSRRTDGRPPRATLLMATSTNHLFLFRRGVGDSGSSSRSSKAEN